MPNSTSEQSQSTSVQAEDTRKTSNQLPNLQIYINLMEYEKIMGFMEQITINEVRATIARLRIPFHQEDGLLVIREQKDQMSLSLGIINELLIKNGREITFESDKKVMQLVAQKKLEFQFAEGIEIYKYKKSSDKTFYCFLEQIVIKYLYDGYIKKHFENEDNVLDTLLNSLMKQARSNSTPNTRGTPAQLLFTDKGAQGPKKRKNDSSSSSSKELICKRMREVREQVELTQSNNLIQGLPQQSLCSVQDSQAEQQVRLAQESQTVQGLKLQLAQQFQVIQQLTQSLTQQSQAMQEEKLRCQALEQNTQNLMGAYKYLTVQNAQLLEQLNTLLKQPVSQPRLPERLLLPEVAGTAATASSSNLLPVSSSLYTLFPGNPVYGNVTRINSRGWEAPLGFNPGL